jgi:WD40 repeat protein
MACGRGGGQNASGIRGAKQATNSLLEPANKSSAGPSFRAAAEVRVEKIKVLLFTANPRGTAPLDLSREFREIDEEVGRGSYRNAVELILVPGTRPVDLMRKLNENQPQVVHFSSHGNPDEIILESGEHEAEDSGFAVPSTRSSDQRDMTKVRPEEVEIVDTGQGEAQAVSKSALVNVLRSCNEGNLRLVVLNACSTRNQAEALTEIVEFVVSMNRTITDRSAIKFAASFYGALAFGRSVQKAFEQGVARLSAEGVTEVDSPELTVRAGVDSARVVLVGSTPSKNSTPAPEAPFIVPFPRKGDFVGRDGDLTRLHAQLSGPAPGPVGIRPAGLTGMGGIGKTQLVVEYVYRHRDDYPDGIFWLDAAGPLDEGFARLATEQRLKWAANDQARDEQIRAAFEALNTRPNALLVLDNLSEPAALAVALPPGCTPEDLRCRLLFTTRRHDLGRFVGIEVTVLPEEPALQLLLSHPSRRAAFRASHPDHDHARAIARMLGRLPLALELAGAYLGKYSRDVSLEGYREALKSDGVLATLDADAAELTEADLRRMHDRAVAATICEQWVSLRDESARLLLRVASLFSESIAVPLPRLGLLTGLGDDARPGRRSPLRRAAQRLEDACLVERLESDQLRVHPLIREFAAAQTPPEHAQDFRRESLTRAASALERFQTLEAIDAQRGVDSLQEDLIAFHDLCPTSASDVAARIQSILRLMQREAHNLRVREASNALAFFAQQVRNRAVLLNITPIHSSADERLAALSEPHFALKWTTSRDSPDLVRTLAGHSHWVSAVAVTLSGRHALSGSEDRTLKLWDLQTGQLLRTIAGHEGGVKAVSISPDGVRALSGAGDGTLKLWDLESGRLLRTLVGHEDVVTTLTLSADWRRVLSGSRDRTLRLWHLQTGETLRVFVGHTDGVTTASMTRDACQAVSGSRDHTLRLWDLRTGQILQTLTDHEGMICTVAVSPDGRRALSGSESHNLKLWDLRSGQLLRTFAGHEDGVSAISVTPDWRQALSGSHDRTLRLWDLQSGQHVRSFAGHDSGVGAVVITADGRRALSGDDRTVKFWDLVAGQSSPISAGHEGRVNAVAMNFDAGVALSGSRDRTLKL